MNTENKKAYKLTAYNTLTSTNSYLKEDAKKGAPEGHSIIAASQSGGKGRMGRSFFSPDGTGLYLSTLLRPSLPPKDAVLITIAAAVATAKVIEEISGKHARIKWVNDIFIEGKKVCGILTESALSTDGNSLEYAILGIGINLTAPKGGFPDSIKDTAGTIFDDRHISDADRISIAEKVLDEIYSVYKSLQERKFMPEYRSRSILIGRPITVTAGEISSEGTAVDIDESGNLILLTSDGKRLTFSSGEARVKGIY